MNTLTKGQKGGFGMADVINKTGCVALYAARIHYYAGELVKTHRLEGQTGFDDQPWEMPYQRLAAKIYPENLPNGYLATLASVFAGCAQTMDAQPAPPAGIAEDWWIVHAYLTNGSTAIAEMLDIGIEPEWEDPTDKDPTTPNNVRFDLLATYTTAEGAIRLCGAGHVVAEYLHAQTRQRCPLSELQLGVLADAFAGVKMVDIAEYRGFSRSALYREIEKICDELKVEGKQQAVVFAVQHNWI